MGSIPIPELVVNSGIGIDYLNEMELINLELKFPTIYHLIF